MDGSGTWIGAAVRANGAQLRGARGWAGEFGFAPIALEGGRVARLDDLAGGAAVARRLGTDGAGAYELAARGDANTRIAVREAGENTPLKARTTPQKVTKDIK
jgi:predicted NBD/HSP70 family sugar kinase